MAAVFQSVQTSNSGTTSVTVTKPTSLALGDLMIAHCAGSDSDANDLSIAYSLSGWTAIAGDKSASGPNTHRADVLYKVAVSGDVSASNFTFSGDSDLKSSTGAIYRFTGAASEPLGSADDNPTSSTSHTFTNTITPAFANSILLHLTSCVTGGGTSWSSQAIVTSNPSWTERYDISNTGAGGGGDTTMAGATGARPETTATGNSTATTANSVSDSVGILVAIYSRVDITVSATPLIVTATIPNASVSGDANVTATPLIATGTIPNATVTTPDNLWTNDSKSSTTWVNEDKS